MLSSWNCEGCTNICYRLVDGQTFKYCKPILEGRHRTEWVTETFVDCLDKTSDQNATDSMVRLHPDLERREEC